MADWLESCHDAARLMADMASDLDMWACRLGYVLPESPVIVVLRTCAEQLREKTVTLNNAAGDKLSAELVEAKERTALLLKAALAGALMANSGQADRGAAGLDAAVLDYGRSSRKDS